MEKEPNNYYEAPIFGELQLTFGATDEKQLVAIKELILDAIEDLGFHGEYEHVDAHWRMSGQLVYEKTGRYSQVEPRDMSRTYVRNLPR